VKESEYDLRIIADYGLEYAVDYIKLLWWWYISDINTKKITALLIGYQMKNDETNDNPYVFHKDIYQYTNLKTLQIENISPEKKWIDHIAWDISQLAQLEALILGHNNIETLPTEIGTLKQLKELHMAGNILKSLPTQIWNLTRLEVLDVSANQITQLPPEIGLCTWLKELKFGYNQLTQLPPEIIKSCKWLEILTINNNQFTSLPIEIRNLTNLKVLDIGNNQLTQLPPEIIKLQNLETLIITNNPGLKWSFTVKQSTTVIWAKYDWRTKKNNNDWTATYTK
jgi:Leucine-rich repeat (LRR) protein